MEVKCASMLASVVATPLLAGGLAQEAVDSGGTQSTCVPDLISMSIL